MSDTHWSSWDQNDPQTSGLIAALEKGYDEIWHAGDIVAGEVLEALEAFCSVVVVKGNCDGRLRRSIPHAVIEQREGVKMGMIHGWDVPLDHAPAIVARFPDDIQLIIHGHTHRRRNQTVTGPTGNPVRIVNPGSVSSPRGGETPGLGELIINGDEWEYRTLPL